MKEYTYTNKAYLGIKEGIVPPAPQYLWLNSEDNKLYKFGNTGWEPIRDEVLKGFTAEQIEEVLNSIENKVDKVEGKGLSTNDYTNEEKAKVAENKANIATNAERIAEHGTTLTEHDEAIAHNAEAIGRKAEKNGRYDKFTSGFAANIVGDGSATEEVIGFRPTAGEERNVANTTYIDGERNEAARMTAIKGNSVVWNNQVKISKGNCQSENIDGGYRFTPTGNGTDAGGERYDSGWATIADRLLLINGDIYLILATYTRISKRADIGDFTPIVPFFKFGEYTIYFQFEENKKNDVAIFHKFHQGSGDRYAHFTLNDCIVEITNICIIDLTQMFGAGNEPTTIEEFYQRIPVGVDINAYNEGELIDGHYSALRSTAFNQYNGTYAKVLAGVTYHVTGDITSIGFATEEGGTTENITLDNGKYKPTQNGYIYATGENICIHLCWSEYAHMEDMYEVYKPYVRDLSWIKKYFPNGMRSAGNVRDEIRYNAVEQRWEAVQRVGVVDLGSLEWRYKSDINVFIATHLGMKRVEVYPYGNNVNAVNAKYENAIYYWSSAFTEDKKIAVNYRAESPDSISIKDTDFVDSNSFKESLQGVILNYELAEPIVTPIDEDINLDYDCSDYGTEELISEGVSAPLVADVVYAPNALSTLKQVPDILRRLAVLEAKAVENTNVTMEE